MRSNQEGMKKIKLTLGKFALVDDEDYHFLNQFTWSTHHSKKILYARMNRVSGMTKSVAMHRLILEVPDGKEIDHINHNGLDNRRSNLRICSSRENNRSRRPSSKTKLRGVTYDKGKGMFRAYFYPKNRRKLVHLGHFKTAREAAAAYNEAALKFYGTFAYQN